VNRSEQANNRPDQAITGTVVSRDKNPGDKYRVKVVVLTNDTKLKHGAEARLTTVLAQLATSKVMTSGLEIQLMAQLN